MSSTELPRLQWSPSDYIAYGCLTAVVGGVVAMIVAASADSAVGLVLGLLVVLASQVLLYIGLTSLAVAVGMREHQHRLDLREAHEQGY